MNKKQLHKRLRKLNMQISLELSLRRYIKIVESNEPEIRNSDFWALSDEYRNEKRTEVIEILRELTNESEDH